MFDSGIEVHTRRVIRDQLQFTMGSSKLYDLSEYVSPLVTHRQIST